MFTKKSLVLVLTLVLVFSLSVTAGALFGFGNDDQQDGPVTIDYWNLFGGGDAKFMDKMIKEFNETHEDIQVKSTRLEFSEYYTKLKTATASGNGPDVAITHVTRLPEMVNEGLAISLDELAAEKDINWLTFNENILEGTVIDGKHYAVPLDTHPQVLYFNKEYLREADLLTADGKPKIEESPAGFIEFLTKLQDKSSAQYGMSYWTNLTADGHFRLWLGLYNQLGGGPIISGDEITIDRQKAIEAAAYMQEIYKKGLIPLHSEYMESVNLFRNKKTAALLTGVWITGTLEETEGLDLGVVPMPKIFDKKATWANSHTLILPYNPDADKRKQEAALEFAKWMTDNGELWAKAGHIPSKDTIKKKEEFKNMPYRMDYVEAANYAAFNKAGVNAPGVKSKLVNALSGVWNEKYSAEEGIDKGIEKIKQTLDR